jgi:hypothetical protein
MFPDMFNDWDLLQAIDDDLTRAAARQGIPLPAWPAAIPASASASTKKQCGVELWHVANARKDAVEQVMKGERRIR